MKGKSALANVISVLTEAGGKPDQVARLVIYVTDKNEYKTRMKEIGERYRARMGKHFPAMVLVEVKSLLEESAMMTARGSCTDVSSSASRCLF